MIRKATEGDIDFIYNALKETFTPWTENGISESVKNDLVYVYDGIGTIIARAAADECEILNFAVCREKRGRGYGSALLRYLLSEVKKTGVGIVYLDVRKTNAAAISVYKKAGFEICGEREKFYRNPQEDAILMKASL